MFVPCLGPPSTGYHDFVAKLFVWLGELCLALWNVYTLFTVSGTKDKYEDTRRGASLLNRTFHHYLNSNLPSAPMRTARLPHVQHQGIDRHPGNVMAMAVNENGTILASGGKPGSRRE